MSKSDEVRSNAASNLARSLVNVVTGIWLGVSFVCSLLSWRVFPLTSAIFNLEGAGRYAAFLFNAVLVYVGVAASLLPFFLALIGGVFVVWTLVGAEVVYEDGSQLDTEGDADGE